MVDSRIAPRYRMNKPAVAEYGGDKYPCLVRDLSTTGAALEFSDVNLVSIATAFTLVIPDEGLCLRSLQGGPCLGACGPALLDNVDGGRSPIAFYSKACGIACKPCVLKRNVLE